MNGEPAPRASRPAPRLGNFIAGRFVPPHSGAYFDDINPATEEVIASIPDSDGQDIDDAVAAARAAFPGWSRTSAWRARSSSKRSGD